jgi:hypothetical protein
MSRRTTKIVFSTAALVVAGGVGLWTATAAPAGEVPPVHVESADDTPARPAMVTAPPTAAPVVPPSVPAGWPSSGPDGNICASCMQPTAD